MRLEKTCTHCRNRLEVRTIAAARVSWADERSIIFARTSPVLLCPVCDQPPSPSKTAPLYPPKQG